MPGIEELTGSFSVSADCTDERVENAYCLRLTPKKNKAISVEEILLWVGKRDFLPLRTESRDVLGWMLSRDRDNSLTTDGDHLGIDKDGHLIFQHGDNDKKRVTGKAVVPRWSWTDITLVRDGETVTVYVNGKPEITTKSPADFPADFHQWFIGGRSDNRDNWEGKLDEVAVFDRALTKKVDQLLEDRGQLHGDNLMHLLDGWVRRHIMEVDQDYAEFLNDKSAKPDVETAESR